MMSDVATQIVLTIEPLTQAAFAPFGDLIEVHGDPVMINEGTTERYHRLGDVTTGSGDFLGGGILNIFRAQPRSFPMPIKMMERHPLGSQAFLPTNNKPYLVLVCEGENEPDPNTLRLFLANDPKSDRNSVQGVNYKANCWHHPLLALDERTDFWVVDRAGPGNNLEERYFPEHFEIEIPVIS